MDSRKRLTARLASDRHALSQSAVRLILADAETGGERIIACPACGGAMRYTISKPLGRVMARCERPGCLSVSEPLLSS